MRPLRALPVREPGTPGVLHDLSAVLERHAAEPAGVLWRLAEPGRQLDANVLNLAPGHTVETHAEPDLDVLVVVLAGSGTVEADGTTAALGAGELLWLPRGSRRSLAAGPEGLAYLTVHTRRPGMRIRSGP